jgi:hypothetical protein
MYQWCGFKSRRGKNKNLTALKSNCAFLRIGETVESGKSSHVIQKRDVILNHIDKNVSVTINSSKTDQYGIEIQWDRYIVWWSPA